MYVRGFSICSKALQSRALELVLAAIAHTGGSHQHSKTGKHPDANMVPRQQIPGRTGGP
jgi:hypothetical protein